MNKVELIARVKTAFNISTFAEAEDMVDYVLDQIKESVAKGEKVSLAGFGIFTNRKYAARKCRNPKTGGTVDVPAGYKVKFKCASSFREALNK